MLLGQVAMDISDFKKAQQMFERSCCRAGRGGAQEVEVSCASARSREIGEAPKAIKCYERAIRPMACPPPRTARRVKAK